MCGRGDCRARGARRTRARQRNARRPVRSPSDGGRPAALVRQCLPPRGIATHAAPQGAVRAVTTRSQDRPRCLPQQRDSAFACKAKADERDPLKPLDAPRAEAVGWGCPATSRPPHEVRPCPASATSWACQSSSCRRPLPHGARRALLTAQTQTSA